MISLDLDILEKIFIYFNNKYDIQVIDLKIISGDTYGICSHNNLELIQLFISVLLKGGVPILYPSGTFKEKIFKSNIIFEQYTAGKNFYGTFSSGSSFASSKIYFYGLDEAVQNCIWHGQSLNLNKEVCLIQSLPLYHSFGVVAYILTPALFNLELSLIKGSFFMRDLSLNMKKENFIHLVPAQLKNFLSINSKNANLSISVGAGTTDQKNFREVRKKCDNLFVTYGLSEAGPRVSTGKWEDEVQDYYCGEIFEGIKYKFSSEDELLISTPTLAKNIFTKNDYFHTGDRFKLEGDSLFFKGRISLNLKIRGRLYLFDEMLNVYNELNFYSYLIIHVDENSKSDFREEVTIYLSSPLDQDKAKKFLERLRLPIKRIALVNGFLPFNEMGKVKMEDVTNLIEREFRVTTQISYFYSNNRNS